MSRQALVEVVVVGGVAWTVDEDGRGAAGARRRHRGPGRAARSTDGRKVLAAADDGSAVYVANAETGIVDRLDPAHGRGRRRRAASTSPTALG